MMHLDINYDKARQCFLVCTSQHLIADDMIETANGIHRNESQINKIQSIGYSLFCSLSWNACVSCNWSFHSRFFCWIPKIHDYTRYTVACLRVNWLRAKHWHRKEKTLAWKKNTHIIQLNWRRTFQRHTAYCLDWDKNSSMFNLLKWNMEISFPHPVIIPWNMTTDTFLFKCRLYYENWENIAQN